MCTGQPFIFGHPAPHVPMNQYDQYGAAGPLMFPPATIQTPVSFRLLSPFYIADKHLLADGLPACSPTLKD
jgi:hypothetical protein